MLRGLRTALLSLMGLLLIGLLACGGGAEEGTATEGAVADVTAEGMEATGSASITGNIIYEGEIPRLRPIDMSSEPTCAAKHEGGAEPQVLVLGEGNSLANVLVTVQRGYREGDWKVPSEPVTLDQEGCRYEPHVLAVRAGQTVKILNSDGILHNVHALPEKNQEFNMGMPATLEETETVFETPEDPFRVKCDVHGWMNAYIAVLDHPFFAVTDEGGTFTISGLEPGEYEIQAWHERLGTQTATVAVAENESKAQDFTFSLPQ